ncbi:uncharacterized protein N0V89_011734 [Didymosphaeria variabile]|uniref:Uncharacterized protein n=1 Tax=Didymosphaeria variabile TaxID=1932322 RepID=A0A9W9C513_9PLEO|nr:uncharacterized protein N0V89_011734 [Didymosphaeria variabile]KAJ4345601.1 hypothetical protein N0V89_011734 [Didymosphaeria variabile]
MYLPPAIASRDPEALPEVPRLFGAFARHPLWGQWAGYGRAYAVRKATKHPPEDETCADKGKRNDGRNDTHIPALRRPLLRIRYKRPPISPISRQSTFPHKTSAAVSTRTPYIDTSTPAINAAPVELDSIPASPGPVQRRATEEEKDRKGNVVSPGLGEVDEAEAELLGEGGKSGRGEVTQKRAAMLARRGKDPGVIVDLPKEPTAEEVLAAKATEGVTTPAVERR